MSSFTVCFSDAKTRAHLAHMLGTSERTLSLLVDGPQTAFLTKHEIHKRNRARGKRIVWEVHEQAARIVFTTLLHRFHDFAKQTSRGEYPGAFAYGYVPGRSVVGNARKHLGAPLLLHLDIRNFFPSVTRDRIVAVLVSDLSIAEPVARDIANMVCVDGVLALGLPPSPLFANLACRGLDRRLSSLAAACNSTYTRYADDLTFSGTRVPQRTDVAEEVEREGFALADDKCRLKKRGQAIYVTGLSVADSTRPRIPKRFKHLIRQELHFCQKYGIREHIARRGYPSIRAGVNRIDGRIRYVRGVERDLGDNFLDLWRALLERDGVTPSYASIAGRQGAPVTLFVDETTLSHNYMLALICVVVEDVDEVRRTLSNIRDDIQADPFTTTRKPVLTKKGLHFTDISPDARQRAFDVIANIPCEAFVDMAVLDDYENSYERLLRGIISRRFVALDGQEVTIVCEQNPRVNREFPERLVRNLYAASQADDARCPSQLPTVRVAGKEEPGLWLADSLLWAFQQFAEGKDEIARLRFERFRSRYRLIRDHRVASAVYTRRRPFPFGAFKQ